MNNFSFFQKVGLKDLATAVASFLRSLNLFKLFSPFRSKKC